MISLIPPTGGKIASNTSTGGSPLSRVLPNGTKHFTNSGTAALALAIQDSIEKAALPIDAVPEVILPAYCCPDVLSAILFCGAKPILVDFIKDVPQIDLSVVSERITRQTTAIVCVNFLGVPERLHAISQLSRQHEVSVIDDRCQSFPNIEEDGLDTQYAVFSFGRGKPVPLCHGGLLVSKDRLSSSARAIVSPGTNSAIWNLGYKAKIRLFHAVQNEFLFPFVSALGLVGQTEYKDLNKVSAMSDAAKELLDANVDQFLTSQPTLTDRIRSILASLDGEFIDLTSSIPNDKNCTRLLRYPLLAKDRESRDALLRFGRKHGVCISPLYGAILPDIRSCALQSAQQEYLHSRDFAIRLATIPLHIGMNQSGLSRLDAIFGEYRKFISTHRN